jgi:hypothetical protein
MAILGLAGSAVVSLAGWPGPDRNARNLWKLATVSKSRQGQLLFGPFPLFPQFSFCRRDGAFLILHYGKIGSFLMLHGEV